MAVTARLYRPVHVFEYFGFGHRRQKWIIRAMVGDYLIHVLELGGSLGEVVGDTFEAVRVDLRSDVVEHEPLDSIGITAGENHRNNPAHRSADQRNAIEIERIDHDREIADIGWRC